MSKYLSALVASVIWACPPCVPPPPCQAAGLANAIFIGTVSSMQNDWRNVRIDVERQFKGNLSGTVSLSMRGLEAGVQYLFYAQLQGGQTLVSSFCARTNRIEAAYDDVDFLERYLAGKTSTQVRGTVEFFSNDRNIPDALRNAPLRNVAIKLAGYSGETTVIAGPDGDFFFDHLDPATYNLRAELPGHQLTSRPGPIQVSTGACQVIQLVMQMDRRIHGTVRDAHGEPVKNAAVQALSEGPDGYALTDKQGHYEITGLVPGNYLLGVNLHSTPSAAQRFTAAYYPNVHTPQEATQIFVPSGAFEQSFDLLAGTRLPTVAIHITVIGEDASNAMVFIASDNGTPLPGTRSGESNVFMFELCVGVAYEVTASIASKTRLSGLHLNLNITRQSLSKPADLFPINKVGYRRLRTRQLSRLRGDFANANCL